MKHLLTILLTIASTLCIAQTEIKKIVGTEFEFRTISQNDTIQTQFLEVYRNNKKLITHTLSDVIGDCSSENIQLGAFEIKGATIIFYSYWASGDRMGSNVYPYGFRKQTYSVSDLGAINLSNTALYIESFVDEWAIHKGMKYLNRATKTKEEKALLEDYILKAEKMYTSNFVFGNIKEVLEAEVRKKLHNEISINTGYWKEHYGDNCHY